MPTHTHPTKGHTMTEPKTIAEQLDAAQNGEQFSNAILGLFTTLEKMINEDD